MEKKSWKIENGIFQTLFRADRAEIPVVTT
jgi:hypothetical protein